MPRKIPIARTNVLGVGVSAISMTQAVRIIEQWIVDAERQYVTVTGVHGVMESQYDPELLRIHNRAGLVTPDGMPLVWLNWLSGQRHVTRVYGPDLMLEFCEATADKAYRHFYYGGAEGVADELARRFTTMFPELIVAGTYCPPFRPLTGEEEREVVATINASGPDLVWVGLSTPKQERWMAAFRERLNAPVLIGVGAAFDFHTGRVKQAPSWMQKISMEWLFRLLMEPKRLWKRYLRNNPEFLFRSSLQLLRLTTYPDPEER